MADPKGADAQASSAANVAAEQALIQNLYNGIITMLTSKPPGANAPAFDPATTLLVMRTPGLPVDQKQFKDPFDPANTDIDPADLGRAQAAAKATADLANVGLALSGAYSPSKGSISDMYSFVTNATLVPTHLTDAQRKAMLSAAAVVYKKVPKDPGPDKPIHFDRTAKNYTDDYKTYLDARKAYRKAVAKFNEKFISFQSDPALKAKWPIVGGGFQADVDDAWSTLQDAGANDFRAAEATLATAASNQVAEFFADAKAAFATAPLMFGTGKYLPATVTPNDWWDATNDDNWASLSASAGRTDSSFHKDSHSFSASASVNMGLWSFGADVEHTSTHEHSASASGGVSIKYDYQIADFDRDWMSNTLFTLPNWSIGSFNKNSISTGTNDEKAQAASRLPLIPTSMLLVREVEISAGFTQQEMDHTTSHTSGGGHVGYGPFSVGAKYSEDTEDGTFGYEFANGKLKIHGAQIIAYICTIVPACPPMDGATK